MFDGGAWSFRCVVIVITSMAKVQASAAVCWNCHWIHHHLHSIRAVAGLPKTTAAHGYGCAL